MSLNFVNTFNGFKFWFGLAVLLYLIIALVVRSKRPKTPVWSIMAFSSFMAGVFGLVGVDEVISAVDLDAILFLIGMFSLVSLANSSGLLEMLTLWFISAFRKRVALLYGSALLFGLLAAFVVNDTVALMGPPIAYTMSRLSGVDPRLMFLLLAFSLTIGSVMTPIGNPQNMLIAVESGVEAPFIRFLAKLALPTILNLVITTYIMVRMFRVEDKEINAGLIPHEALRNKRDATLAALGIILTIILLLANDVLELYGAPHIRYRGIIPFVVAATGIYLFTTSPRNTLTGVGLGNNSVLHNNVHNNEGRLEKRGVTTTTQHHHTSKRRQHHRLAENNSCITTPKPAPKQCTLRKALHRLYEEPRLRRKRYQCMDSTSNVINNSGKPNHTRSSIKHNNTRGARIKNELNDNIHRVPQNRLRSNPSQRSHIPNLLTASLEPEDAKLLLETAIAELEEQREELERKIQEAEQEKKRRSDIKRLERDLEYTKQVLEQFKKFLQQIEQIQATTSMQSS
jgi:hypothetical protein